MNAQEIIKQALSLPLAERRLVVETVTQSLTDTDNPSDAQIDIIDQRLKALRANEAQLVDGEQAFRELRQKHN